MVNLFFSPKEQQLLTNLRVKAVILFGSQAQSLTHPGSDFDIALIANSGAAAHKIYDQLYLLLSEKINQLVNIDIVFLSQAPMELQSHVAKNGRVIFEANPNIFADFKQRTMLKYSDFAPLRQIFQQATLARI